MGFNPPVVADVNCLLGFKPPVWQTIPAFGALLPSSWRTSTCRRRSPWSLRSRTSTRPPDPHPPTHPAPHQCCDGGIGWLGVVAVWGWSPRVGSGVRRARPPARAWASHPGAWLLCSGARCPHPLTRGPRWPRLAGSWSSGSAGAYGTRTLTHRRRRPWHCSPVGGAVFSSTPTCAVSPFSHWLGRHLGTTKEKVTKAHAPKWDSEPMSRRVARRMSGWVATSPMAGGRGACPAATASCLS